MDRGEKSDEEEGDDDVLPDEGHLRKKTRRMQKESPPSSQHFPPSEPVLPVVKMSMRLTTTRDGQGRESLTFSFLVFG